MRRALGAWRRFYGENPLHLLALLACFALVAAVARRVSDDPSWWWMLVWFLGAVVAHDLIAYPLYALADRPLVLGRRLRERRTGRTAPRVAVVDHIRLPALGSLLLLVVFWPSISREGEPVRRFASGRTTLDYLDRWLWITAGLFLLSALLYAVRRGRARCSKTQRCERPSADHAPRCGGRQSRSPRGWGPTLGAVSEEQDRYVRVAEGFTARVEALDEDSWSAPTPCPDWTVRDLVAHVVATHRRVLGRLPGEAPAGDQDPGGATDLVVAWRQERDRVVAALSDPDRAATPVTGMGGDQPFATLVDTLLCTDTLIHTWDLARAAGLDERLDPDALARARGFMEPLGDVMRSPGGFGPPLEPAPGADEQARFLAFCGREV